jgi:hypothetical protein
MARDADIDLSYVLTAEMLTDCFTKPLLMPAFLKQCATMEMIGIGPVNGLVNGLRINGNSPGMVSDLKMTSGMPLERKLMGQVCFEEILYV